MISLKEIYRSIHKRFDIRLINEGLDNLDRISIASVTVMESVNIDVWATGGEFLLTSATTFPAQLDAQITLVKLMRTLNIPCLAIKPTTADFFLSPELIEVLYELKFPVFIIPVEVTYLDIMNYINAMLYNIKEYNDFRERAAYNIILKQGVFDDIIIDSFKSYDIDILELDCRVIDIHFVNAPNDNRINANFNELFKVIQLLYNNLIQSGALTEFLFVRQLNSFTTIIIGDRQQLEALDVSTLLEETFSQHPRLANDVSVGISKVDNIAKITRLQKQASFALSFSSTNQNNGNIELYENIEFFYLIYRGMGEDLDSFIADTLQSIRFGTMLFETLHTYFKCNEHLVETSKKLFIHINTLNYRLKRVENITGLSLNVTQNKIKLYLATLAEYNR